MTNIYTPNNRAQKKYMEQKLPKMKDMTTQQLFESSIPHSQ